MSWAKRNWLLLPIIFLITYAVMKKMGVSIESLSGFFSWNLWATTPPGEWLDSKFGLGTSAWLWVPAAIVIFMIFRSLIKSKSAAGTSSSGSGASSSIKTFFDGLIDLITGGAILLVVGGGLLLIIGIIVRLSDIDDAVINMADAIQGNNRPASYVKCTTQEELGRNYLDAGGRDIVLCRDSKPLKVYGEGVKFRFSPNFARDHSHLLEGRALTDFTWIEKGPLAYDWIIAPKIVGRDGTLRSRSAWDRSGLDAITVHVYAK